MSELRVERATPILRVADFDASVRYYVDRLGFTLEWSVGRFGSVRRGDADVFLAKGVRVRPVPGSTPA